MAAIALAAASVTHAPAAHSAGGPTGSATELRTGKPLYRKYCGQCHILTVALAVGFGSNNGLGTNGGPNFDTLRVPFNLSIVAVEQPFIGHEIVVRKMTWTQVRQVSAFLATVTKNHSVLAQAVDG